MKGSHYTIESPAVRQILAGVYRNANRNYFRYTADGKTEVFAVRTRLMELGMGSTSASNILEAAKIPKGTFIINKSTGGTRTVRADVEEYSTEVPPVSETGVVLVFVHHTGTPPKAGEGRTGSSAYAGYGTSDIANWARGTITLIDDGRDGIYTVEMAKRGARTGVQSDKGRSVDTLFLRHAESGIYWEPVDGIENQEKLKQTREVNHLEGLRNFIIAKETVMKPWFETEKHWEQFGLSRDGCKVLLSKLVAEPAEGEQPIYLYKAKVSGYSRRQDVYSTLPEGQTTIF